MHLIKVEVLQVVEGGGGGSSYPFQVNSTVWLVMYNLNKNV